MSTRAPVLLLFLDGVGIGPSDPDRNPFLRAEMPNLAGLLDGPPPTLDDPDRTGPAAAAFPLDTTLEVEGVPRSGTGQTALLTGRNAPRAHGGHFGPWPPVALRPLLEAESLLRRVGEAGLRAAFANAYPEGYPGGRSTRRVAAPPLAARAAGLLTRHHEALARGDAVASEIVNVGWREVLGHRSVPEIPPEEAGVNLARIAGRHDFTLYAHYATDHAGHRGGMEGAVAALARVDAFLGGVVGALADDGLVVVASDHGNIEDVRAQHTRNPALGLLAGAGARKRAGELERITDVAGAVLEWLGAAGKESGGGEEAPGEVS